MVDDIRPSTRKSLDDENQNEAPNLTLHEAPLNMDRNVPSDVIKEEEGFVVLPEKSKKGLKKPGNPFKKIAGWVADLSKKQKILFAVIAIFVLGSSGAGVYALFFNKPTPVLATKPTIVEKKVEEPPKPITEASKLSGVQVEPSFNKKPVISIQIENSPDARPQSALNQASVVFEAIAEGGITRFNATFLDNEPDYIGPIRSVRPYYAVLTSPFDPIFVHAGGSSDGLAKLGELGLKDLDHGANGAAFQRVSDRFAPHNLYSSYQALKTASDKRGYTTSDTKSFLRKPESPLPAPTAKTIDMGISSPLYNTHYDYDAGTNSYKRSEGGSPHVDLRSGIQISPKVVVGLVMNFSQNGIYSVYQTVGSGTAVIFQDGNATVGTWTKTSEKEQIIFKDQAGNPLLINPGQTWLTLVKSAGAVSYAP